MLRGSDNGGFQRLLDDSDGSGTRVCTSGCAGVARDVVGRDLKILKVLGPKSDVISHNLSECSSVDASTRGEVRDRAALMLNNLPSMDSDIGEYDLRKMLDQLCIEYCIPKLDDRRFLLVFSRFAPDGILKRETSKQFFYSSFKRILRHLEARHPAQVLARQFLVFHSTQVNKHYRFKSVIGQGSFGIVHKVVHVISGQGRVCKSILKGLAAIPMKQLESEIKIIAQLDHPNIVRLHEYFEDDTHIHLIMENCNDGDLMTKIRGSIKCGTPLSKDFIKRVIRQILSALSFMHNEQVIHKDVKPENIMFVRYGKDPNDLVVKVIDFGLSEMFGKCQNTSSTVAGTAFYMSPQVFKPPFDNKCDIWAVGVITFFMLTGFLPFFGSSVAEVKSNVLYRKLQWPSTFAGRSAILSLDAESREFVENLLEKDASLRPSAATVLALAWLSPSAEDKLSPPLFSPAVALNIVAFSKLNWIKRCMIHLIAHTWDSANFVVLHRLFMELDSEHRGYITVHHLSAVLQTVLDIEPLVAWRTAGGIDLGGNDRITFTSLSAACIYPLIEGNKAVLKSLFQAFSPNNRGQVVSRAIWEVISGRKSAFNVVNEGLSFIEFDFEFCAELKKVSAATRDVSQQSNQVEEGIVVDFTAFKSWLLSK